MKQQQAHRLLSSPGSSGGYTVDVGNNFWSPTTAFMRTQRS